MKTTNRLIRMVAAATLILTCPTTDAEEQHSDPADGSEEKHQLSKEQAEWERMDRYSITSLQEFLKRHPQNRISAEVNLRIELLQKMEQAEKSQQPLVVIPFSKLAPWTEKWAKDNPEKTVILYTAKKSEDGSVVYRVGPTLAEPRTRTVYRRGFPCPALGDRTIIAFYTRGHKFTWPEGVTFVSDQDSLLYFGVVQKKGGLVFLKGKGKYITSDGAEIQLETGARTEPYHPYTIRFHDGSEKELLPGKYAVGMFDGVVRKTPRTTLPFRAWIIDGQRAGESLELSWVGDHQPASGALLFLIVSIDPRTGSPSFPENTLKLVPTWWSVARLTRRPPMELPGSDMFRMPHHIGCICEPVGRHEFVCVSNWVLLSKGNQTKE